MLAWILASLLGAVAAPVPPPPPPTPAGPWGYYGHALAGRAAAVDLPPGLPAFFREAGAQLEYLDAEPDRWRERSMAAMDQAFAYDHYIDLENVPAGALEAPDRWRYLDRLYRSGLTNPVRDTGFLPYRILELYQRIVTEWSLWRRAPARERPWIEARILNDAGVLGHYVTDASQPHHTTIHFNGWDGNTPNPEGFTTDRGFHARFEAAFVEAHVTLEDLLPAVRWQVRDLDDPWPSILEHVQTSNDRVTDLYRLDRDAGFRPDRRADPASEAFAVERLAAGVSMLRDLWWSAWIASGTKPSPPPPRLLRVAPRHRGAVATHAPRPAEDVPRMADGRPLPHDPRSAAADPFEPLDPDLTVFALANAMDLEKDRDGLPCRWLAWYRDGLERSICIEPAGPGLLNVWVGARRARRGEAAKGARRELRGPTPLKDVAGDLRGLLLLALDEANALGEADLA